MADGVIDPTLPVGGGKTFIQNWADIRAMFAQAWAHILDRTTAHGIDGPLATTAEVVAARGTRTGLTQRFDEGHNPDGSHKSTIPAAQISEWVDPSLVPVKVDANTFTVIGDKTDLLPPLKRVRIDDATTSAYGTILSSTYNAGPGTTTIVLYEAVVPTTPVGMRYGLITGGGPTGSVDVRGLLMFTTYDTYNRCGF